MTPDPERPQVSPPAGWNVADDADDRVSVTHDERDVEVIVEEFEMTGEEIRSRTGGGVERTVFEVGYRPSDVESKSLHVSTVDCPEEAERLMLEAMEALDDRVR